MVFQHFNLFPHKTVIQNITMAPVHLKLKTKEEAEEEAMKLLERIGLADKRDEYPICCPEDRNKESPLYGHWQ